MAGRTYIDDADIDALPQTGVYVLVMNMVLRRMAKADGSIDPRRTTLIALQARTGLSNRVILPALQQLEDNGVITVLRARGRKNAYSVRVSEKPTSDAGLTLFDNSDFIDPSRVARDEKDSPTVSPLDEKDSPTVSGRTHPQRVVGLTHGESSYINVDSKVCGVKVCGGESASRLTPATSTPTNPLSPKIEDVTEYFTEVLGRADLASDFFDAYEARGWLTFSSSPVPVRSWRASANRWLKRAKDFETERIMLGSDRARSLETDIDRAVREAQDQGLVSRS